VLDLVARGCRDVLLLNHIGGDAEEQLTRDQDAALARSVGLLARALRGRATIKLSVCWGERLDAVPRLVDAPDCGAGVDFVVVTSDRRLQACSFQNVSIPFRDAPELLELWRRRRDFLSSPSPRVGCGRVGKLPDAAAETSPATPPSSKARSLRVIP